MSEDTGSSSLFEKVKQVMEHPSAFFDGVKSEPGIGGAFKYLAILSLIPLIALSLLMYAGISELAELADIYSLMILVIPILIYVSILVGSFVIAGFIHMSAILLGGSGYYAETYKATVYADTPSLLLGWIPAVGGIFSLWGLYLTIKGISTLHEVGMGRAALIIFLPILVLAVLVGVVLAIGLTSGNFVSGV